MPRSCDTSPECQKPLHLSKIANLSKKTLSKIDHLEIEPDPIARAQSPKAGSRRSAGTMLVEPDGIEPTTSCVQSRRSPN